MSAFKRDPEDICLDQVLLSLTLSGHWARLSFECSNIQTNGLTLLWAPAETSAEYEESQFALFCYSPFDPVP
jgi:hypothetical protein